MAKQPKTITEAAVQFVSGLNQSLAEAGAEMMGGNAGADFKGRVAEIVALEDEIDALKVKHAEKKADAKNEGYDMKALAQSVREKRKGAKYQAAQQTHEAVVDTYRTALGLPTTLAAAQKALAEEASRMPDADSAGDGDDD